MSGVDNADENSLSLDMYDAKRRTKATSTHATEDGDIESQVRASLKSILPRT